jgi:polyribonucleotide 5'-hydroxyl-kinase
MSIPGLGQIPAAPAAASTRTVALQPAWEWRFEVSAASAVAVKLVAGTAEKDGVELALRGTYALAGTKGKITTWHGCTLEIDGRCDDDFVAEYASPQANPAASYLNLHARLAELRAAAARDHRTGPRVLIAGPPTAGKTTLARTLTGWATRQGGAPLVVNTDPHEGMLSLPGTLSAAVFATVIDPESVGGWGSTPTSGPSGVPVKLPLVYNLGRAAAEDDPDFYRDLIGRLAATASGRLSEDEAVRASGVVVDTMGVSEKSKTGLDLLAHIVDELSGKSSNESSHRFRTEILDSEYHRGPRLHAHQRRADEALRRGKDVAGRADSGHRPGQVGGRGGAGRGVSAADARGGNQGIFLWRRKEDAESTDPAGGFRQLGHLQGVGL